MKILVVENDKKHIADAVNFFKGLPEVEVVYASTLQGQYNGASNYLDPAKVDGVISDIFFTLDGKYFTSEEPIGVAVLVICNQKGIPCVLNTSGYHHGQRYQWISWVTGTLKAPAMVDTGSNDKNADTKNWAKAFETLKKLITKEENV